MAKQVRAIPRDLSTIVEAMITQLSDGETLSEKGERIVNNLFDGCKFDYKEIARAVMSDYDSEKINVAVFVTKFRKYLKESELPEYQRLSQFLYSPDMDARFKEVCKQEGINIKFETLITLLGYKVLSEAKSSGAVRVDRINEKRGDRVDYVSLDNPL